MFAPFCPFFIYCRFYKSTNNYCLCGFQPAIYDIYKKHINFIEVF
nr:MAG TPA: hypothetical protein [Caudoviricetes sp.]